MPPPDSQPDASPPLPPPAVRFVVSALVIVHFFAIGSAVLSYSSVNFPAPPLAVLANKPMQPYLQATFLNNAYRFFAPNPGTPTVFWFRVQYENRSVRWSEVPGEPNPWLRGAYQRRLNHAIMLGQHLVPHRDGKRSLSPMGRICLESWVRHVARSQSDVKSVGVYVVHHAVISPEQVRNGWTPTDVRTYHPTFVGAFNAKGVRIDELQPGVLEQPIGQTVAGILQSDVYPLQAREPMRRWEDLHLPMPVARFLTAHPELFEPGPAAELQERVERLANCPSRHKR
jgi:hypothetical protein